MSLPSIPDSNELPFRPLDIKIDETVMVEADPEKVRLLGISWVDQPREVKLLWKKTKKVEQFRTYREAYKRLKSVYPDGVEMPSRKDIEQWSECYKKARELLGERATRELCAQYLPEWSERVFYAVDPLHLDDVSNIEPCAGIFCKRVPQDTQLNW